MRRAMQSPTAPDSPQDMFPRTPTMARQNWPLPASGEESPRIPDRSAARPSSQSVIPGYHENRASGGDASMYSGAGVWNDDGYQDGSYPDANPSRPLTGGSMTSRSSLYSMYGVSREAPPVPATAVPRPPAIPPSRPPQAPLPAVSPRARAPLGPPPSARRGPSSYYPQYPSQLLVTPIVEESDSQRTSERGSFVRPDEIRGSYASSNAIPIGIPNYYLNHSKLQQRMTMDSETSNYDEQQLAAPPQMSDLARTESPPALIRQASLGKKSKPTLTTIRPPENKTTTPAQQMPANETYDDNALGRTVTSGGYSDNSKGNLSRRTGSSGALEAMDVMYSPSLDGSSSESEGSDGGRIKSKYFFAEPMPARSTMDTRTDQRVVSILNRLEKGGAIPPSDGKTTSDLSKRLGGRKPSLRIDVQAVHEAEERGSLTSLPDLIARATRLASNLDRGKTASKLGMDWMYEEEKTRTKEAGKTTRAPRPGSFGNMLAMFPPNSDETPESRGSGKFQWPTNLRGRDTILLDKDGRVRPTARKRSTICGMPLWVFFLLLLLLILLIAAAVILPVVLIVIPRQDAASKTTTVSECETSLPCENSGKSIVGNNGDCRCLCVDGFTGVTCTVSDGPECTGFEVDGVNATVGDSVPRLFDAAETNFSVPLESVQILSLFAATNLSCESQNALITFNGAAMKRSVDLYGHDEPTPTLVEREVTTTSAGIVYAVGTASATATNSPNSTTSLQIDFGRVAVLFVLQDSAELDWAIDAQADFQDWLDGDVTTGETSSNITLSNDYSIDINTYEIVARNGSVW